MHATPVRRDLKFDLDRLPPSIAAHWHPLGAPVSQFYNAMSLFFPEGERFFIHSVRHFRDRLDDRALKDAVTAFIGQEAMHGREHDQYNALLQSAGLPADALVQYTARLLGVLKDHLSPSLQLAVTLALEHFTAMLADLLLREPALLDAAEPSLRALWRWHAAEETEHKAVAYDVYQAALGRGVVAYALRTGAFSAVMPLFLAHVLAFQLRLLAADRRSRPSLRDWARFAGFLGGRRGLLRQMIRPGLAYFRPSFHPWDDDNRDLLGAIDELVAAYQPPAATMRRAA